MMSIILTTPKKLRLVICGWFWKKVLAFMDPASHRDSKYWLFIDDPPLRDRFQWRLNLLSFAAEATYKSRCFLPLVFWFKPFRKSPRKGFLIRSVLDEVFFFFVSLFLIRSMFGNEFFEKFLAEQYVSFHLRVTHEKLFLSAAERRSKKERERER